MYAIKMNLVLLAFFSYRVLLILVFVFPLFLQYVQNFVFSCYAAGLPSWFHDLDPNAERTGIDMQLLAGLVSDSATVFSDSAAVFSLRHSALVCLWSRIDLLHEHERARALHMRTVAEREVLRAEINALLCAALSSCRAFYSASSPFADSATCLNAAYCSGSCCAGASWCTSDTVLSAAQLDIAAWRFVVGHAADVLPILTEAQREWFMRTLLLSAACTSCAANFNVRQQFPKDENLSLSCVFFYLSFKSRFQVRF